MRMVLGMLLGLVLLGVGCEQRAEQTRTRPAAEEATEIAKVKVTQAGTIYVNGKTATLEELRQEFARLKQANGAVWYYRENPQEEPTPQAMAVIEAIVEAKLPVRLVEKDFE